MEIKYRFRRTGCYIARNDHYVSWTSKTSERNTIVKYSIWDFFVKLLVPTILNKLWENGEFKIVDASFKQPQANACKKGMESAYNHCFKETMWFYRKMFDPIRTSCISDKSKKRIETTCLFSSNLYLGEWLHTTLLDACLYTSVG